DEAAEGGVGHRVAVDPEPLDGSGVGRRLLRVVAVRAHAEGAAGDPGHVLEGRRAGERGLRDYPGEGAHRPFPRVASTIDRCFALLANSVIFSIAWSMVKLAAFWRGGNSLKDSRNWAAIVVP